MSDVDLASVNGKITPLDRACVPVNDHGFLYGDSVYETIRTYAHRPFLIRAHLERLQRSAAAIRLTIPWSLDHVAGETERVLAEASAAGTEVEFAIRIIATRGAGPLGYDPDLCPSPNLVILVRRLRPPTAREREVGIAVTIARVRRNPIEALDPRIKSSNLLNNILASQEAKDAGADEAILLNTAGDLAEGALTNVFFVDAGSLMTPSVECGILSGVTRDLLLDLAREEAIPCLQGRYRREDLLEADEVFLTSTTREILPVCRVDGRAVGAVPEPARGPITQRLQEAFRRRVERFVLAEARHGKGR